MKTRLTVILMMLVLCSSLSAFAAVSNSSVDQTKVSKIERYIYGDEQSGEADARLNQLEEDMFGHATAKPEIEKVKYLHDFIFKGATESPSLDMKLSFLEWKLFNHTGTGNLEARLADLDRQVIGNISNEPLAFRLEQLVHLTIENGLISLHRVRIPRGTEIKLVLGKSLSSRNARKDDLVQMTVADNLFVDRNILAMSKGGIISARIRNVRRGGRFGRTGYVNLQIRNIESMDSTELPVEVAYAGMEKFDKKRIGMAAGASTLGYLVLGPIGIAGGAFVKGDDVEVPAGTEISVRTLQDTDVTGVLVHRK
ncbi:MAG: hypothetical protein ACOYXC_04965 [Candidatus Rifleibacteriota bacterium]